MRLEDLPQYRMELGECLTKIDITAEDDQMGHMLITKTKETYVYMSEEEADTKINEARQEPGFAGAEKKYKAGKINKAGEITKPETWTVVIKINQ